MSTLVGMLWHSSTSGSSPAIEVGLTDRFVVWSNGQFMKSARMGNGLSFIFVTPSPSLLDYWGPVVLNFMGLLCILAAVWQSKRQFGPGKAAFLYLVACILFLCAARWSAVIGVP